MNQPNEQNRPIGNTKAADIKTPDAAQKANPNFTATGLNKTESGADNKAKTTDATSAMPKDAQKDSMGPNSVRNNSTTVGTPAHAANDTKNSSQPRK